MSAHRTASLLICALTFFCAVGCSDDKDDGQGHVGEPSGTDSIALGASLTDDELIYRLLDVTGCGTPLTQREYGGDADVDMYVCGFNRGFIYLTGTPGAMDTFLTSVGAPCDRRMEAVRGDRWYFTTGDDSLTERLVGEGGEPVNCGTPPPPTEICDTQPPVPVDADVAEREATAAVARYLRRLGDVMRNAQLSMEALSEVAVGSLLESDMHIYGGTRDYGTREGGQRAKLRQPKVVRADLANTDIAVGGGCPYVVVEGCRDTTNTKELNVDGKDASLPFTPAQLRQRYTVVLTEDGWRVFDRRDSRPTRQCPNRFLNRPGSGGGSQAMKDESHVGTKEVQRRAA